MRDLTKCFLWAILGVCVVVEFLGICDFMSGTVVLPVLTAKSTQKERAGEAPP